MGERSVAQTLWLLGQDDQWLRPRAAALPVAAAAGALLDVIASGSARWVDGGGGPAVEVVDGAVVDDAVTPWLRRLVEAASAGSLPVLHAIDAMGPGVWEAVGAEAVARGDADAVPHRIRRWLPARYRPRPGAADEARADLLAVLDGSREPSARDLAVLAVASCADVAEHVLSGTAFTDSAVLGPTDAVVGGSDLVRILEPPLGYLVSLGPTLGTSPPSGSPGAGSA